jgi:hypothetical protein
MAARHQREHRRLLRQYFPKGTDLSMRSVEEIAAVAAALNSRPRKTLDWKTPAEALPTKAVLRRSLESPQYTSIEFGHRCREAGVRPSSMGSVGDAYDNAMCECFFATLECELLDRRRFKTQAEARIAVFEFIEGFYNPRRRHSSIGYLSPIDYERRHAANPDARQPAAVLASVKDKPFGRPPTGAVLDRRCARRPHRRAGRDERMAPPGAEQKNDTRPESKMPSDQIP